MASDPLVFPDRRGPERRRQPRGGRRVGDNPGFAPLVMLIGDDPAVMDRSEAILAKLRFAVATSGSVDHALRVLPELKPDLLVAGESHAARLRGSVPAHVTVVVMDRHMQEEPEALVEEIRQAIRRTLRAVT